MYYHIISKLGPGILMASAAVGVSHLVQSTRAGVYYGFAAVIIVLLANLMKYPFYEYGHRYAASTGNNLLDGYKKLGRGYLWSFFLVNVFTSIGSIAVVSLVTSALLKFVLFPTMPLAVIAGGTLMICWIILLIGHYKWLESSSKLLMAVLCLATLAATIVGAFSPAPPDTVTMQTIFSWSSMPFLVALMGWMPASSEVSVWQSLWVQAEGRTRGHSINLADAKLDFNVGYIIIAVLACLFIAIGAFTLQGQKLSDTPAEFAGQLIDMYGTLIGDWSKPIVAVAAIAAMISTVFTLVDAYPRSLSVSIATLFPHTAPKEPVIRHSLTFGIIIAAVLLIGQYSSSLKLLVDLVTIFASLAMPYFAWLNMRCIKTIADQPPVWVKKLAVIGLVYLLTFTCLFLYSYFFM